MEHQTALENPLAPIPRIQTDAPIPTEINEKFVLFGIFRNFAVIKICLVYPPLAVLSLAQSVTHHFNLPGPTLER